MARNRYIYNIYKNNKLDSQFTSLNKALLNMGLPIEKVSEIANHFKRKPFEKQNLESFEDEELGMKVEIKIIG